MKAIFSGSFDPVTLGHLDIITRAATLFDSLTVVLCHNAEKKYTYSLATRKEMLLAATANLPNVTVDICDGLLAAYTEANGVGVIVRGVRDAADMPYEMMLATINRNLRNRPETVFLPSKPEHSHISSSFVKEMIRYHEPLEPILPAAILPLILEETKH